MENSWTSPPSQDSQDSQRDYAIGYRKPPVHTQFKPGRSGNPAGRAKAMQAPSQTLDTLLHQEVTVREGDKKRRMTKIALLMSRTLNAAIKGERSAFRSLTDLMRLYPQSAQSLTALAQNQELAVEDEAMLKQALERLSGATRMRETDPPVASSGPEIANTEAEDV